jgi:hypothetical protein
MGRPNKTYRYTDWNKLIADKTEQDGDCLVWTAGTHSQGYPMCRWDGNMVQVARIAIERRDGIKLTKAQRVKNRCGKIMCVNPDHHIIAEPGTEEWKCVNFVYPIETRQKIRDEYEQRKDEYGVKQRLVEKYKVSRVTLDKIIKDGYNT